MGKLFVRSLWCFLLFAAWVSCTGKKGPAENDVRGMFSGSPMLPGNFADPCILQHDGYFYIYATTGRDATVWYSRDFRDWKLRRLNWPTSTGIPNMWAPAVVEGKDGRFYMYYSLNSQIYAGVADHPLGPFSNLMPDEQPFIRDKEYFPPKIHSIDADCFVDDDGQAYLYWGSGWDFKDGVCAAGMLNDDMCSFKSPPVEITPQGYFEAPHMFKRKGKYYLMYSDGFYYDDSYKVRYAISDSPLGPFEEGEDSPILASDQARGIDGPGHNFTFNIGDDYYIIYHRHEMPLYEGSRQVCVDKMEFDGDGFIKPVVPDSLGIKLDFVRKRNIGTQIIPEKISASSSAAGYEVEKAFDDNMGTLWVPASPDNAYIEVTFRKPVQISKVVPVFAEVAAPYQYKIEYKYDKSDNRWEFYAAKNNGSAVEWPEDILKLAMVQSVRLTFKGGTDARYGLWELKFYDLEFE